MSEVRRIGIILPIVATATAMIAFQTGAAIAKQLFATVGPEGAATLRLFFGAIMLLSIMRPWRGWRSSAPLLPLFGLGVSIAGVILLFYKALEYLPLGVTVALQFLGPLGVAILGSRKASDAVWAALAGAGVWCLVGTGIGAAPIDAKGLVLALGAAGCWAGYIVFGRYASTSFGRSTAALSVTIAAVLLLPVGLIHAGTSLFTPAILPLALLVAGLSSAIPFSLEFYALSRVPARTFAVFASLEPAFGVLSGLVFLHERLRPMQLAGIAMVMGAAAGAAWSSTKAGAQNDEPAIAEAPPI